MNWFDLEQKNILQTYKRQKIIFVKGKGKYLWDIKGKKYLDLFSGISVCNLGHCNSLVNKAIKNQIDKLIHISNLYYTIPQIELAEKIIERTFKKGKVFFSNSGAEANECAIKIARKYGRRKNLKPQIITFKNSFHGRTIATLTATGQKKFHIGFEPLLNGFKYAEFNNINSVKRLINNKTCAVIIEPIQGEGGIYPADKNFLKELRYICNKNKILLIFDEIQTGIGRTGKLFCYQYFGVEPDIITTAKGIANGLPLGVTIVKKKYSDILSYGEHGSTFGGNIVSSIAGIKVLELLNNKLLNKITFLGNYFLNELNKLKLEFKTIKEVRGIGLMIGIELTVDAKEIVNKFLEKGIVINSLKDRILRLLPPFIIEKSDIDFAIKVFRNILLTYE